MDPIIVPGIILAAILLGKKKEEEPVIEEEIEERFPISEMPPAAIQPSVVPIAPVRPPVPRFVPGVIFPKYTPPVMPPTPPPVAPPIKTVTITTHPPPSPPSLPTGPTNRPPVGEYEWGRVVRHPQWQTLQFSPHPQRFLMRNKDGRAVDVTMPDPSWNIIAADSRGWMLMKIISEPAPSVGYLSLGDFI